MLGPSMATVAGFDELFDLHPDALLVIDAAGRITRANGLAHAMFRHPTGALVGELMSELLPSRLQAAHAAYVRAFFERPATRRMGEGRILEAQRSDGTCFDVDIALAPLGDAVLAVVRDMTKVREHERLVREQLERERVIRELARVGTFELDLGTDKRTFSPELMRMLGLDREPATSLEFMSLVHPDDRPRMKQAIEASFLSGRGYELVSRIRSASGEWRWFESRVSIDLHRSGAARTLRGVVIDVTDAVVARRRLEEQEAQLRSILDAAPDRFVVVDRAGVVEYAGATVGRPALLGEPRASALAGLDSASASALRTAIAAAADGTRVVRCEIDLVVEGERRRHAISARRMVDDGTRVLLVASDVGSRRDAEQARQA
ncbi:MAG: PAS domain S-box protein [Polyangiales bacterium]